MIPFNKPFVIGKELEYIREAVSSGKISGNGVFAKKCQEFFENRYGYTKTLLTTSCTDALEMAALLCDIQPGDEVIMPSYTFVSTANSFILRGAEIVFADSEVCTPNIDVSTIDSLITRKTKAVVVVHYAGMACDMDAVLELAKAYNLYIVEDAAQAIDSHFNGIPLGSFGNFSAFSFHETKNVISGEGGMIVINKAKDIKRAEIIREKGTNRSAFFRGEIDKYGWVDIGSSFLPSEIVSAYLFGQLEFLNDIQAKRKSLWEKYYENLTDLRLKGYIQLPQIPCYATNNGHLFYVICGNENERDGLLRFLNMNGVNAVFHYLPLHKSKYYRRNHPDRSLPNAERYSECLLRLPLFYELSMSEVDMISDLICDFFKGH